MPEPTQDLEDVVFHPEEGKVWELPRGGTAREMKPVFVCSHAKAWNDDKETCQVLKFHASHLLGNWPIGVDSE